MLCERRTKGRWAFAGLLLLIPFLASCGGESTTTAPTASTTPNAAPTISTISINPPGIALVAVPVTFTASASDPDKDPLTYTWTFGDNTTATGVTVSHAYASALAYPIILTVTDGRGGSATQTASVGVASLTGNWLESADQRYGYTILQTGTQLTGSRLDRLHTTPGSAAELGFLSGTILDHRNITFKVEYPATGETDTITAAIDPDMSKMLYTIRPGNATSFLMRE